MIKVEYTLYCDKCGSFIAELEREQDQYNDYCSGEGYKKDHIHYIQFNVFCNEICKQEYYKDKEAIEIIEYL